MTCKEVEKWIPLFLRDDLDTDDLREFMEHIDKCEECRAVSYTHLRAHET